MCQHVCVCVLTYRGHHGNQQRNFERSNQHDQQQQNAEQQHFLTNKHEKHQNAMLQRNSSLSQILLPVCPVHLLTYHTTPYMKYQTKKATVTIFDSSAEPGDSFVFMDGGW